MQYVACKFRENDTKTYTYAWDGEPFSPGEMAKVADNRSDGWKRVWVASVTVVAPPFACKPILGRITGEDIDNAILAATSPTASADALNSPLAF